MTAQILVVDDVPANVKLLEAKLLAEYYDVITAEDGYQAIDKAKEHKPDLILLDVMMPGMDGFECCQKLKEMPETAHIPVVMVTALNEAEDRVRGLESGADDFLTKPINDLALMARMKSLVRTKMLLDELRMRDRTGMQFEDNNYADITKQIDLSDSKVLIIDDDAVQSKRLSEQLSDLCKIETMGEPEHSHNLAAGGNFDTIIISTGLVDFDGLRLASQFKSQEQLRHIPIVILVDEFEQHIVLKGLEMGINDYIVIPVDPSELRARVKTQIRRKKYQDALRSNFEESISLAVTDTLTGLYNRNYLNKHLENLVRDALVNHRPLSLLMMDLDHFKQVNDSYGHDCGDQVLSQLAVLIKASVRGSDLAARYGGEEFIVLMPGTRFEDALEVAERMRALIESTPLRVNHDVGELYKTASIGITSVNPMGDTGEAMIKRADTALYEAKESGRNKVVIAPIE